MCNLPSSILVSNSPIFVSKDGSTSEANILKACLQAEEVPAELESVSSYHGNISTVILTMSLMLRRLAITLHGVSTIDWEIFTSKIICVKGFRVVKFSQSRSIREIFLTVDDCNMDERLESSWRLVYYQVSGEPGISRCSHRSDI